MPIISKETWEKFDAQEKKEIRDYINDVAVREDLSEGYFKAIHDFFPEDAWNPQPLTYEDVARELFKDGAVEADICKSEYAEDCYPLNCRTYKQAEKLLAINKLLNVAKYLNGDWKPDWSDRDEYKWCFCVDYEDNEDAEISYIFSEYENASPVYFRTEALAKQAIKILGEDTVRLALTTDF